MGYNDGIPYPITVSHDGDRQRVIRDTCHHEIVGRKIRHGIHQWDRRVCEIINGIPQCDAWWDTMMSKTAMGYVNDVSHGGVDVSHGGVDVSHGGTIPWRMSKYPMAVSCFTDELSWIKCMNTHMHVKCLLNFWNESVCIMMCWQ